MSAVTPFHLAIPDSQLDDLRARLRLTRWPDRETVDDWRQGAPLAAVQALCDHWLNRYDWRQCEATLNGFGQYRTEIDGLGIHFLHVRSPEPDATPLILTHGWPGSVVEFLKVIGPLSDPRAHGGDPADAFHVVAPSLPGYGFSDHPTGTGWTVDRIAAGWTALMKRLGYDRFVAQGGDWGATVTTALGVQAPPDLAAIHINLVIAPPLPRDEKATLSDEEKEAEKQRAYYRDQGSGYATQQRTRPQTLGYGLADSPAGQAAWIFEKFYEWTDCDGDPLNALGADEMLDNIMLYWLTNSGTSSARLYWESFTPKGFPQVAVPTGCSLFPREIVRPSREAAARRYTNIVYWNAPEKGGHFAAFEQPDLFVGEVRAAFRPFR